MALASRQRAVLRFEAAAFGTLVAFFTNKEVQDEPIVGTAGSGDAVCNVVALLDSASYLHLELFRMCIVKSLVYTESKLGSEPRRAGPEPEQYQR